MAGSETIMNHHNDYYQTSPEYKAAVDGACMKPMGDQATADELDAALKSEAAKRYGVSPDSIKDRFIFREGDGVSCPCFQTTTAICKNRDVPMM